MPNFRKDAAKDIPLFLDRLLARMYSPIAPLTIEAWSTDEPVDFAQRETGRHRQLKVGDSWGKLFDCAWFRFRGSVPAAAKGQHVVALIDVNGELCVVDHKGVPKRGLTNGSSVFDYSLGQPGKRVLDLYPNAKGNETISIWADAGCNDLFGSLQNNGTIKEAQLAVRNEHIRQLYYDMWVLHELMEKLPDSSARHQKILRALTDAMLLLKACTEEEAQKARKLLKPLLAMRGGDPSLQVSAVGHAHLDLAWLWPIRETIRKGARTFATALDLIERYPDYVFGASQPQLFLWMKEYYPELYRKIKAAVKKGRIEPQGAMWVEADTNITGGESLVRQILHGKRFFLQEFGVDIDILWLPDVFGYSASLPQLLKLSGVEVLMTQKLSWSKTNSYPHHSFKWQGVDGTEILAHLFPEDTYNGPAAPRSLSFIEKNYKDKDVSNHALMVFGIGDGGGGPGMEHLERLQRIKNLAGLCPCKQESSKAFADKWRTEANVFATWRGELYLEMHQGTLTTQGNTKRYNRLMEIALRDWELSSILCGVDYPSQRLEKIWQEVLLYQFHDILPGSSIKRVYDEAYARYEELLAEANVSIASNLQSLAQEIDTASMESPVLIYNSLSWTRKHWVKVANRWTEVTVPPMGYVTIDAAKTQAPPTKLIAEDTLLENDLLRVQFAADGSIRTVYDKANKRQVLTKAGKGNVLAVYHDEGNAWDMMPMNYDLQTPEQMTLLSTNAMVDGPEAIIEQVYAHGESRLNQRIVLTAGSRRIDFRTKVHWLSSKTTLRTSFDVDVNAESANYEIQFGHLARPTHDNTTWDLAKNEVAANKWADVSVRDYGVALLNDCKYGHKIKGQKMELSLIRSVPYPGAFIDKDKPQTPQSEDNTLTDQCEHEFTYSLYPHDGDLVSGGVIQAGYELNMPLWVIATDTHKGKLPSKSALFEVDNPGVIIETVKRAEDSNAVIVRMYESTGGTPTCHFKTQLPIKSACLADLMEQPGRTLKSSTNGIKLSFKPFEIKTVMLEL